MDVLPSWQSAGAAVMVLEFPDSSRHALICTASAVSSGATPSLQVLYRFLVEFSEFDWEHYCLSIQGPIPVSSFPEYRGAKAGGTRDGWAGRGIFGSVEQLVASAHVKHCGRGPATG